MTGTYDWNPMPHRVSVRCPGCARLATFEFSEVVRIKRKADVPFFETSSLFDYVFVEEKWAGQSWHGAVYFAGLHGGSTAALRDLPEGYAPEDWDHSRYLVRSRTTDQGSVICSACGLRRKHALVWPAHAWFQVDYRGQALWGFDRGTTVALRDYIASVQRKPARRERWASFLLHVPSVFLAAPARATLVKRLDRLLGADPIRPVRPPRRRR